VASAEAEVARARLLTLVPEGFEEVAREADLELAAYTDAEGEASIRAVFDGVSTTNVPGDWEERWREFHRPAVVEGVWIGPPWVPAPSAMPAVVIEPGRAFGTGAHPTTRACIELLARSERGSVLDAGCGSGVLAIVAGRLGFRPVHAVDLDNAAVEATRANAQRNGVDVDTREADALTAALPAADLLVANIELRAVEALLERWPGEHAVVSGFLAQETPRALGWRRAEHIEVEGWAADRVTRPG
jgi:ribosomal protein L11 methyltransferase